MIPVNVAAVVDSPRAAQPSIQYFSVEQEWNLVFTTKVGTPLDERHVFRRFQNVLALAGLPKMRLQDLRHSAGAILIARGVNIKAISEMLGHNSVAFTLQVYGHLLEETKRETGTKMDAALVPVATTVATKPALLRHIEAEAL
jgi:site-specific recombinase XerD